MPILAGRWGQTDDAALDGAHLTENGASSMVVTLADACTRIKNVNRAVSRQEPKFATASLSV
jgi:hypothetical protein